MFTFIDNIAFFTSESPFKRQKFQYISGNVEDDSDRSCLDASYNKVTEKSIRKLKVRGRRGSVNFCLMLAFFLLANPTCEAEFNFNFGINPLGTMAPALSNPTTFITEPDFDTDNSLNFMCNMPGYSDWRCDASRLGYKDYTSYLAELVTIDGIEYFHQIVGTEASGFVQEYYVPRSEVVHFCASAEAPGRLTCGASDYDEDALINSANGSARPNAVVIKQLLKSPDDSFLSVYLKDRLAFKPFIQQIMNDDTISTTFETDMREIAYSESETAAGVINTVTFNDPWLAKFADWDINNPDLNIWDTGKGHNSVITSGKYRYDEESNQFIHVAGEEVFDPTVFVKENQYLRYFDPEQNIGCDPSRVDVECLE